MTSKIANASRIFAKSECNRLFDLSIVTEKVFDLDLEPFKINSEVIREFVQYHNKKYGRFFYGDLIIISPDKKIMWIKHHEGAYSLVDHN